MSDLLPIKWFAKSLTHLHLFASAFFLLALLPFYRDLDEPLRRRFVPSLALYGICVSFVSFLHFAWSRREAVFAAIKKNQPLDPPLPGKKFWALIIAHAVCLVALIVYTFWKIIL